MKNCAILLVVCLMVFCGCAKKKEKSEELPEVLVRNDRVEEFLKEFGHRFEPWIDSAKEATETPNDADVNDIIWLDFTVNKAVCLQFTFPDANIDSVDEAAAALREMDTRNAKEFIDIEVTIGDETHTASFEEFFEWMGFKR